VTLAVEKTAWAAADRPAVRHVAIIMDGNGRWAAERGLPRAEGHRQGVESVRRTVEAVLELGITHLTLFSFSSENWARPKQEINDLFGLLRRFIRRDLADLHKNGVKIRVIGTRSGLDGDILRMIDDALELTKDNTALNLTIAFNYGARDEIARAARRIAEDVASGRMAAEEVTPESFGDHLDTSGLPDPDLLIRTSGEVRLSNFLLWQLAYAEFVFVDTYWPDFSRETLEAAIAEYQRRSRRFGGLSARSTA
jgi:undecaprenyl diphosphate synthase